ncbi:MAG: DUF1049 domain-containing protein [Rhodospirillales bacterium]|nr:DUF1049 domain-containing protein [Rhodospirillales bacterium]
MKVLFWIIVPLLFLIVVVFAVRNHALVEVSLWPILLDAVMVPIYAITLVALFIGFLWGGLVAWLQGSSGRARRRALARRLEAEHRELTVTRDKLARLERAETSATIPSPPVGAA